MVGAEQGSLSKYSESLCYKIGYILKLIAILPTKDI